MLFTSFLLLVLLHIQLLVKCNDSNDLHETPLLRRGTELLRQMPTFLAAVNRKLLPGERGRGSEDESLGLQLQ